MTLREAQEKAAKLTEQGVPTVAVKAGRGGWQTRSVISRRASTARYNRSAKGRRAKRRYNRSAKGRRTNRHQRVRYMATPKGRASLFRKNMKKYTGRRLAVTDADLAALRERQGNVCPITRRPLSEIPIATDHCHGEEHLGAEALRGVIHRGWNSVLGRTDEELFALASNLQSYVVKRKIVLRHRECRAYRPPVRRVSKRRLKQLIENYTTERERAG